MINLYDHVRSFDFPQFEDCRALEGEHACYAEGVVVAIVKRGEVFPQAGGAFHDCDRYAIKVTRKVFRGEAQAEFAPFVFPPLNGTPSWWQGRSVDGVELINLTTL